MSKENQIVIGLRFGKKDIILKRWNELSKDVAIDQTCYHKIALLSYMKKIPLKLAEINPYLDVNQGDTVKTITFTEGDGDLYNWIEKMPGKRGTRIKEILNTCIDITSGQESITNYAILLKQLEGKQKIDVERHDMSDQLSTTVHNVVGFEKESKRHQDKYRKDNSIENPNAKSINNLIAGSMVRGKRD